MQTQVWEVRYTVPYRYNTTPSEANPDGYRIGRANREVIILCATAQRAIELLLIEERATEDGEVEIVQVIKRNRNMKVLTGP